MVRFLHQLAAVLTLLLAFAQGQALAQKRVALVIGNGAYLNVARLPNPPGDAAAMAAALQAAGFDSVTTVSNADRATMVKALRTFEDKAQGADIGLVYYAGHGIEANGLNYLIPVDARLASDRDLEDEAVSLDRALRTMDGVGRLRLVILDACRDNPFAAKMARANASRAVTRGLGRVEPAGVDTLVAYAARAGTTASDGSGANSPFTAALMRNLLIPGLDIRLALGQVRDDVLAATGREQEPFVYGSLGGGILPLNAARTPPSTTVSSDGADYALAERIGTAAAWQAFLALHPAGFYADLARAALNKKPEAPVKTAPPAVVAALPPPAAMAQMPVSASQACVPRSLTRPDSDIYCASSVLPSQAGNSYGVENLFSGSPDRAWVAASKGYATGEWVLVKLRDGRERSTLVIGNGYQKSPDIFGKNSRVKDIEVRTSLGTSYRFRLADQMGTQTFSFGSPVKADWMQITIQSVYAGTKYTDTAVSKLDIE